MEYSTGGSNFTTAGTVTANDLPDLANYTFSYIPVRKNCDINYYRIKITGKDGRIKYSNIAILRDQEKNAAGSVVFPNPTHGELWLDTKNILRGTADITTWNAQGKLINHATVNIKAGEFLLNLPGLHDQPAGTYLIKIRSTSGSVTQRVIKL
jgi:hypothetical protein